MRTGSTEERPHLRHLHHRPIVTECPTAPESGGGTFPVGSGYTTYNHNQLLAGHWVRTISPKVLNDVIFSYNHSRALASVPTNKSSPSALGFTNVTPDDPGGVAPPIMYTADFTLGPPPFGPTTVTDRTFQVQDILNWTKGPWDKVRRRYSLRRQRLQFRLLQQRRL